MTRILGLDTAFDFAVTKSSIDPNVTTGSILLYDFSRSDCWDGDPTHAVHNLVPAQATSLTGTMQDGNFDGPLANIRQSGGALQLGRELARLKIGTTALVDYFIGRNIAVTAFARQIDAPVLRKWVPGMDVALGDVLYHTITPTLVGGADAREVWKVTQAGTMDGTEPQYFGNAEHTYGSAKAIRGVVTGPGPTYGIPSLIHILGLAPTAPLNTSNYVMEYAFLSASEMIEQAKINCTATNPSSHVGSFTAATSGGRGLGSAPTNKQLSFYAEDFANALFNAAAGITGANTVGPRLCLYRLHIEDLGTSGRSLAAFYGGERDAFARTNPARGLLGG